MPRRWLACVAVLATLVTLATLGQSKPPDLPKYERVTVGTQTDVPLDSAPADTPDPCVDKQALDHFFWVLTTSAATAVDSPVRAFLGLLSYYPIQVLDPLPGFAGMGEGGEEACEEPAPEGLPDRKPQATPELIKKTPEKQDNPEPCVCPYLRNQMSDGKIHTIVPAPTRSVTENLELLEKSAAGIEKAKRLVQDGKVDEALECLEEVRKLCPGSPGEKRAGELLDEIRAEEQPDEGGCCCCPLGAMFKQLGMCWLAQARDRMAECRMDRPVSAHFQDTPLGTVLENLKASTGGAVMIDYPGLAEAGVDLTYPVTVHVDSMPLNVVLDQVLRPIHLQVETANGVPTITPAPQQHGEECESSEPQESTCPKCEELHARHAGKAEMVTGLMKACYLAVAEGRHDKAAELARQAHALDPARVEADPLVYKMQLLEDSRARKANPPRSEEVPTCPWAPCHEEKKTTHPDGSTSLVPHLPGVTSDVVEGLDAVLTGADGLR
jgi:hypothetical protein